MEILLFAAGVAAYYLKKIYPVFLLGLFLFFRWKPRFILIFVLGAGWGYVHQKLNSPIGFGEGTLLSNAMIQGKIVSIPIQKNNRVQFEFLVEQLNHHFARGRIQLNCYQNCPQFLPGQFWQMKVKLKKTRNYINPGGFDYVSTLAAKHILWSGYVQSNHLVFLNKKSQYLNWLQVRNHFATQLESISKDRMSELSILEALTLGITQHITPELWKLFRQTGTTHLMVISGAHIGFIAGLVFSLTQLIWCYLGRWAEWIPAVRVASFLGILTGFLYALLAGFGIPAERATIAFGILFSRYIGSIKFSAFQAWNMALLIVLLTEPHAVLQSGFYLSFLAVAILISMSQRISGSKIKKTIILQWSCLIGLMPLTLYWFSYGSINGFVANLIAIPWVSFLIIPMGLFILILQSFLSVSWLVSIEYFLIQKLILYLNWVDYSSNFNVEYSFSSLFSVVIILFALFVWVFVPIQSWRWILGVLLVSTYLPLRSNRVNFGEARVDILDVGQGLSVVIRTQHHHLIYDTGMKFFQGSDMAQLVLIPYLKHEQIKKIDKVVISHPDLDHRGGLESLQAAFPIKELWVDHPKYYQQPTHACHYASSWEWDGVAFKFFSIRESSFTKNNHSCVLKISTQRDQVLLTGDIEQMAEKFLVKHYGNQLASSIMLVPHHGSKTSSSDLFLETIHPYDAIASYGLDNIYHFPHQNVVDRYHKKQIPLWSTEACGAVKINLYKDKHFKLNCSKSLDYF